MTEKGVEHAHLCCSLRGSALGCSRSLGCLWSKSRSSRFDALLLGLVLALVLHVIVQVIVIIVVTGIDVDFVLIIFVVVNDVVLLHCSGPAHQATVHEQQCALASGTSNISLNAYQIGRAHV